MLCLASSYCYKPTAKKCKIVDEFALSIFLSYIVGAFMGKSSAKRESWQVWISPVLADSFEAILYAENQKELA